jgi:hypothetical protein
MSQEHKQNLEQARNDDKEATKQDGSASEKNRKNNKKRKSIKEAISLVTSILSSIEIRDVFFVVAIMAAMLKDISDYVAIGSLPLIGTALTLMASITIIVGMLVSGSYKSRKKNKALKGSIKKWMILGGGTLMEIVFGINFLPMETITALLTFGLTLMERARIKQEGDDGEDEGGEEDGESNQGESEPS